MQSGLPDSRPLLHIMLLTRHFCRLQSPLLFGDNPVDNHHGREGRRLPSPMPQKTARHKPRRLPFQRLVAILRNMDMQETIDSLRTVLESVIAPSVKELRTRLDAVEKGMERLDGRVDHLTDRMEDGFARMDARMERMNGKMDNLAERMDMRMDAFNARMDSLMTAIMSTRNIPDTVNTCLDRLEREVQELRKA